MGGVKKSNVKSEPLAVLEEGDDKPVSNDDKIEQLTLSIAQITKDMKDWKGNTRYPSDTRRSSGYERSNRRPEYPNAKRYASQDDRREQSTHIRNKRSNRMVCLNCQKPGHSFKNCYYATDDKRKEIEQNLPALLEKQRNDSLNSQGRSQNGSSDSPMNKVAEFKHLHTKQF